MILGFVRIEGDAVNTHRDSYLLDNLSVVSVRRPFFAAGVLFGGTFASFALVFSDLLYAGEIATTVAASLLAPFAAAQVGQLKLLSRDLRGSELADVVWGRYATLNRIRGSIIAVIAERKQRGHS